MWICRSNTAQKHKIYRMYPESEETQSCVWQKFFMLEPLDDKLFYSITYMSILHGCLNKLTPKKCPLHSSRSFLWFIMRRNIIDTYYGRHFSECSIISLCFIIFSFLFLISYFLSGNLKCSELLNICLSGWFIFAERIWKFKVFGSLTWRCVWKGKQSCYAV